MAVITRIISLLWTRASPLFISSAQSCSNHTFPARQVFDSCTDLPVPAASLYWNYSPLTRKVRIAYRASQISKGWIAWEINPMGSGMIGSQALVAFHDSNGSMIAYSTSITSYNPSMQAGELSIPVSDISAEYFNNEMIIFSVLGPLGDQTAFNYVWQAGSSISNNVPQVHPLSGQNVVSLGLIDFLSTWGPSWRDPECLSRNMIHFSLYPTTGFYISG